MLLLVVLLTLFVSGISLRRVLFPWEWTWPNDAYRTRLPVPRSVPPEYLAPSPSFDPPPRRANAALVMLARNHELPAVLSAMKQVEDRFNKRFRYPWVLLNEVRFSKTFVEATRAITDAQVVHGLIEPEEWCVSRNWEERERKS